MQFKNLKEAIKYFSDEEVCRNYLIQQRWNGNVECPYCGCTKVYKIEGGKRFKCADRFCHKKFSATVGTIYENSNLPLSTWFIAIWVATAHKKGISSHQLARDLGITQKTAWFVLHRVREMLKVKSPKLLNGTVEIDETYVGGKNGNKHLKKRPKLSGVEGKAMVVGLLDRQGGVKTFVLPDTKQERIVELIKTNVATEAEIITDNHPSYRSLVSEGFNHIIIKKIPFVYTTEGQWHTNNMEGYWSILKRGIYGIYHQVSPKHLQRYCDEFAARYNTRKIADNDRFERSIKNSQGRLKYKDLIANL